MDNFKSNKEEILQKLTECEEAALEAAGLFGESRVKLLCPEDTGLLKNSIHHQLNENDKSVLVGTNTEYALWVEKGTSRMKAQPYMEPGITENMDEIRQIIAEYLQEGMK
jgi:HK97 gp10 family phage protein